MQAFPIAELSFFLSFVNLAANIVILINGILYTSGNSVNLAAASINLQASLNREHGEVLSELKGNAQPCSCMFSSV